MFWLWNNRQLFQGLGGYFLLSMYSISFIINAADASINVIASNTDKWPHLLSEGIG